MLQNNNRVSNRVSIMSLLVAILALVVSIRSCQISEDAQDQSRKQFSDERQLVLQGSFGDNEKEIFVSSINEATKFLEGEAYFPPSIYKEPIPIRRNGEFYHMGSVYSELVDFFEKKIPREAGGLKIGEGHLPIIIKSYYISRGSAYTDVSLYLIRILLMVFEEDMKEPAVKFKNIIFMQHLDQEKPINLTMLDAIIQRENGLYAPPMKP